MYFFVFLIGYLPCVASKATMQPSKQKVDSTRDFPLLPYDLNPSALMTAQDLSINASSNLNVTNNTGEALTVYGVYLYRVAPILPGQDCINGIVGDTNSVAVPYISGVVSPIEFKAGQSVPIGQNFLYNMLYNWIYYYTTLPGTPVCQLPGCTWNLGTPPETPHNWCFQVAPLSPDASYTFTSYNSNVAPFSWAPTGTGYSYDLISSTSSYIWLGPFTCNDQSLTCTTPLPQFQPFPA